MQDYHLFILTNIANFEECYKFDRIDYDSIYELEFSEENSDKFLEAEGMIFLLSLEILKDFRNMKRS